MSSSELTLKGFPTDTILEDIFGPKIYTAVATSTNHRVSMIFLASVHDMVVINLYLEAFRAIDIRKTISSRKQGYPDISFT